MRYEFNKSYWERHWDSSHDTEEANASVAAPHPYLAQETAGLRPGTALDAGSGTGAEAIWLATHGWQVTAADISAVALARATDQATNVPMSDRVNWVEADLTSWEPAHGFDLVTTSYAHAAMPQLAFYERLANWVAPGGTLLIIGHLRQPESVGHDHHPPVEASVTLDDVTRCLEPAVWSIESAEEHTRPASGSHGAVRLHDVVVRATRRI